MSIPECGRHYGLRACVLPASHPDAHTDGDWQWMVCDEPIAEVRDVSEANRQADACEQTGQEVEHCPCGSPLSSYGVCTAAAVHTVALGRQRGPAEPPPPPYVPTRRDYFAAAALTGLLAAERHGSSVQDVPEIVNATIAALDEVKP